MFDARNLAFICFVLFVPHRAVAQGTAWIATWATSPQPLDGDPDEPLLQIEDQTVPVNHLLVHLLSSRSHRPDLSRRPFKHSNPLSVWAALHRCLSVVLQVYCQCPQNKPEGPRASPQPKDGDHARTGVPCERLNVKASRRSVHEGQ